MATSYPTSQQSFVNPSATSNLSSPSHSGLHSDLADTLEAVQTKLGLGDHTVGVWQDYTPTFSGITVGNGTLSGRYCQINKFLAWQVELVVGSTTSIGATIVSYPVSAAQTYLAGNGGQVTCEDAGGTDYWGTLFRYSTTNAGVYVGNASSTYLTFSSLGSSVPFTWSSGDRLIIQDFYEAA